MKKEWILSDEEKQQKRQKIEENRAKKRGHGHANGIMVASPSDHQDAADFLSASPNSRSDMNTAAAALLELQPGTPGERPQVSSFALSPGVEEGVTRDRSRPKKISSFCLGVTCMDQLRLVNPLSSLALRKSVCCSK